MTRINQTTIILLGFTVTAALGCDSDTQSQVAPSPDSSMPRNSGYSGGAIGDIMATCIPSIEICNGKDDDCDGQIDEAKDVASQVFDDLDHCGKCGRSCRRDNAITTCRENECFFTACEPGFLDENRDADDFSKVDGDGCEIKADCVRTSGGRELCDQLDNDCDGRIDEDTDLTSDPRHCGECNRLCSAVTNGFVACIEGSCQLDMCADGWVDLNEDPDDGCEYACSVRATATTSEFCNGLDDDCDGIADEDVVVEQTGCGVDGACSPECETNDDCEQGLERCSTGRVCLPMDTPQFNQSCESDSDCQIIHKGFACIESNERSGNDWVRSRRCIARTHAPICDGSRGFRCVRSELWNANNEFGLCDGVDNDCDGRVDEDFRLELFLPDDITPKPCEAGSGVCRSTGITQCDEAGESVTCTAIPVDAPTDLDDNCDGVDDDCDGRIDEDFSDQVVRFENFEIYAFEASRPGATHNLEGFDNTPDDGIKNYVEARPCSRRGVLPWSDVSWTQARDACLAIGARLCRAEEWLRACGGPLNAPYPYGNRVNSLLCNGGTYDTDPSTMVDDDSLLSCGQVETCVRDGIYDLSGNLKEWVDDGIDTLRSVRGGSFETDLAEGLTCQNDGDYKNIQFHHKSIGFRCCRDLGN